MALIIMFFLTSNSGYIQDKNKPANDHDSASLSQIYALSEDFEHVMSGHLMSDGVLSTSQHDYKVSIGYL